MPMNPVDQAKGLLALADPGRNPEPNERATAAAMLVKLILKANLQIVEQGSPRQDEFMSSVYAAAAAAAAATAQARRPPPTPKPPPKKREYPCPKWAKGTPWEVWGAGTWGPDHESKPPRRKRQGQK